MFRSKDYNSYLYILNQLFNKVESSKPSASRQQSAEIFMVCLGYKAPDYIDPKFLDPKFAFEDIEGVKGSGEAGEDSTQKITSLKKLLDKKKVNRNGYDEQATARNMLYVEADFIDFLESQDPYEYLTKFYKVSNINSLNSDSWTLMRKPRKFLQHILRFWRYLKTLGLC